MTIQVGEIQGYPVQYVQEKDKVFCKNTVVRVKDLEAAIFRSTLNRECIEDKLSVVKDQGVIYLGCLTTSLDNIKAIRAEIKKIRKNG